MNVSESGYYKYVKNLGRPDRDAVLSAAIMEILDESSFNDNYGVPRMKLALFNKGAHFTALAGESFAPVNGFGDFTR